MRAEKKTGLTAMSVEQSSVNQKELPKDVRRRLSFVAGAILAALSVFVVLLRLYGLSHDPPGIINDEGAVGVFALQVLQGHHAPFFPEMSSGVEAFGVYAIALSTLIFGRSLLAFHLPAALASAGTVFAVFWLGWLLFGRDENSARANPWRGLFVAGAGAGLLATSLGQTILSRGAYRANFLPLFLALSVALLWCAWSHCGRSSRAWWGIALAGVCAGLLPYTYLPSRFSPFLFLFLGLSFLIPLNADARNRARDAWPRVALFVGVTGLVAAPILIYFVLYPEHFFLRSGELWLFRADQVAVWRAYLENAWEYLLILGFRGDRINAYNFDDRPMLNAWEATFFWLGVAISMWRWRSRPAHRILLIWLFVMILPATLALNEAVGPNSLRIIGAAPAVYLLVGVGLWETLCFLQKRFLSQYETRSAFVAGVAVSALILAQGAFNSRTFFQEWVGSPEYLAAVDAEMAFAAQALNAQPSGADMVALLPYFLGDGHFGFDYLYQGAATAHVFHDTRADLPQKIQSLLAPEEKLSKVMVVDWTDGLGWAGGEEEPTVGLLEKYGEYQGSQQYESFQIHSYTDVSLQRPWTLYQKLEPPTVHYDRGISLLGIALGQGKKQLSTQQPLSLGQERSLWIALQWRTAPNVNIEYATSLRLHNAQGAAVYQKDIHLVNSKSLGTRHWLENEPIDTLYHIKFPEDLQSGVYELRIIVYDFETLKPTVELGVWEPETVLTNLQFSDVR